MARVVNMKHSPELRAALDGADEHGDVVRIDRRTRWGNPFLIGRHGSREEVIQRYRTWLWDKVGTQVGCRSVVRKSWRRGSTSEPRSDEGGRKDHVGAREQDSAAARGDAADRVEQDRRYRDGTFPRPLKLGPQSVGWRRREILEWIESRPRAGAAADDDGARIQARG